MNTAGDGYNCFATRNQRARLAISQRRISRRAKDARISKLSLNLFELIQSSQILGRADGRIDKWRAHRRLADLFKLHAVAGSREFLKILDDFGPTCEFAIVARTKAEHVFGRGNRFGLRSCGGGRKEGAGLNR